MGSTAPEEQRGDAVLQVDADALRRLGGKLGTHAAEIGQIRIGAKVVMAEDSPVRATSDRVPEAVRHAFELIGRNIDQMAVRMTAGAATYSELEQANTDQLRRYAGS
ncbi:hypothetical protein F3087_39035 [Nocardia colli]|uniref:ESX-1 secretion-associated protein n=1 Tax=Nocardia colli TaxID=2545717 RepID=A0A5N0E1Q4_9NOCA|nr:hypothetical protein [Nocardia colli]KAA8882054.1 hypothetical protein F3087_39035 [Nocardia colli]